MKLICKGCGKVSVDKPNDDCYWCGSLDVMEGE